MVQLVDQYNRPIAAKKPVTEEVARPGLTGVRQAWSTDSAVAGLTPDRLDAILRQTNQGDMDAFLTLAEEMEERDPHYGSVLQTRKLAVEGIDRQLVWSPGEDKHPKAAEILQACNGLIDAPNFDDLLQGLMDGVAKGYAAVETMWRTDASRWTPMDYIHRDPRWFLWDRETGRELRLKEAGALDGAPLPAWKFAIHLASRKSGLPARAGLARLVAFSFVCKLYGTKDWMAYAEIFGIPLRLGKYDAAAKPEDVEVLKRAVFGLGSDAAAVIPAAMTIEFPSVGGTGGADLFERLVKWLDDQVSKAVLGQAGTTDMMSGGGYAQSKTLDGVREDIARADGRRLGAAITRDVLTPYVFYNWGPDAPVPTLKLVDEDPEDLVALGSALKDLVPLGLEVDQDEIREKLGLSKPVAGAKLLTAPRPAAPAPASADPATPANEDDSEAPPAEDQTALARDTRAPHSHPEREAELAAIVAAGVDGWERDFGPEAGQVMALAREAGSFEALLDGLNRLAGDLAAPGPARALARAMFAAAATGGTTPGAA